MTYCDILNAVVQKLDELFHEEHPIFTETVASDFREPCFFVQILKASEQPMIGKRGIRKTTICIRYMAGDTAEAFSALNHVLEILMDGMDYIETAKGLLCCRQKNSQLEKGVLNFFIDCDMPIWKMEEPEETMNEIEILGKER